MSFFASCTSSSVTCVCSNLLSIKKKMYPLSSSLIVRVFYTFWVGNGWDMVASSSSFHTPIHQLYILNHSKLTFKIPDPRFLSIRSLGFKTQTHLLLLCSVLPSLHPSGPGSGEGGDELDSSFPSNFVLARPRVSVCFQGATNHPAVCSLSRTSQHPGDNRRSFSKESL